MVHEHRFACPLPNGLHARPASLISELATSFGSDIRLINERTGSSANAKSVLEIVALDVKLGDPCRTTVAGDDANAAQSRLADFIEHEMPGCDEALPEIAPRSEVVLPRTLRRCSARWYPGTVVCPGIARGAVVVVGGVRLPTEIASDAEDAHAEERKLRGAIERVRSSLREKLKTAPSAVESAILRAHVAIAGDVGFAEKALASVAAGASAGRAIVEAAQYFAERMKSAESAYVRERAVDIEDIALQFLESIYGDCVRALDVVLAEAAIVVAENLSPRQLLAFDRRFLKGIVIEHAGVTSHAVILARSFDIPTLTGVADVRARLAAGTQAVVDANLGFVVAEVTPEVDRYHRRELAKGSRRRERLARHAHARASTLDGRALEVAANVSTAQELAPAFERGADAIGLFRTEMLFMDRPAAPSEDEQFEIYSAALRAARGRPVILRTFDIGGDKPVPYLNLPEERNPFLGLRGVRVYRSHQDVFDAQLRAIVRASAFGPVWIMLPMVSSLDEVRWVKSRLAEVRAELDRAKIAHDLALRIGVMIEVPSVAFQIDQFASEVDFFSIGTNDLAQYFLAVDREGESVAELYRTRHPSFLRFLVKIVEDAKRHGKWIGMCGEMTRSPRNLPLLIALGLDEISTAAPEIAALKASIARMSAAQCDELLRAATACRSADEVEALVASFRGRGETQALLDPECVAIEVDSSSKEEAIRDLVDTFFVAGRTDEPELVEDAIWAREAVYSTGLGHGFAIPHCKTDAISANSIGVARLARPIEWGSNDGEPVRCVILLAMRASDKDDAHMRVFSKLARKLMHDEFRERLLAATDCAALASGLAEELGLSADVVR